MSPNALAPRRAAGRVRLTVLAIVVLASWTAIYAQTTVSAGNILGMVTDPSGAVMPGAQVTVTNKATGQVISTTTSSAGAYTSGSLTR
jgi:hypothetical protein